MILQSQTQSHSQADLQLQTQNKIDKVVTPQHKILHNVVIFPHNNPFSKFKKKPVVLSAYSYIKYSAHIDNIIVITPFANQIDDIVKSVVIDKQYDSHGTYNKAVLHALQKLNIKTIEVHQNIKLATLIAQQFPHIQVSLIKHSEYLINRIKEKFFFIRWYYKIKYLKYITHVFCISNYVKNNLIEHYAEYEHKFILLYNNYGHLDYDFSTIDMDKKENTIIFVGKLIKRKGAKLILSALPHILARHPSYKVVLIGALFSGKGKYAKLLYQFINHPQYKDFIKNNRLVILSNLSNMEVFEQLVKSKIGLVTTIKPEPFGLVALEYALAKCLVISSKTGGLYEITENNALYLPDLTATSLINVIDDAIINYESMYRSYAMQCHVRAIEKFNIHNLINVIDTYRKSS